MSEHNLKAIYEDYKKNRRKYWATAGSSKAVKRRPRHMMALKGKTK